MSTFVSSRTWEGEPRRCRVCRQQSRVEPSIIAGDAPCPRCGTLLWPRDRVRSASPARAPAPSRVRSIGQAVRGAFRSVGRAVHGVVQALVGATPRTQGRGGVYDRWLDG